MLTDYTATITWGDGHTSAGTISDKVGSGAAGVFTVSGTNTYAEEGTYAVSVTITETDADANTPTSVLPATVTTGSAATVQDAVLAASGVNVAATEGASFTGPVATFTDADPNGTAGDYTATITWGDGHTSAGTISDKVGSGAAGVFTVSGTNTYAEEGTYAVSVTITETDADANTPTSVLPATVTTGSTATVQDAVLAAGGVNVAATEGASFTGPVATFTDADPNGTAGDYTATITWGDGHTSAGTISDKVGSGAAGVFTVSGTNTYAEEGTYAVSVTITETDADANTPTSVLPATVTTGSTATVQDAVLAASGVNVAATEGASFTGPVATFTDADPNG